MNEQKRLILIVGLISLSTIALGFVAWWSFVIVAFGAAYLLAKSRSLSQSIAIAGLTPAASWLLSALVRDVFENLRVSSKLATLLHVKFGIFVYLILFAATALPGVLAAWSGAETSKALR